MITTFEKRSVLNIYSIVLTPNLDTSYTGGIQVKIYMWDLHHELVHFQQSRNCFRYTREWYQRGHLGLEPVSSHKNMCFTQNDCCQCDIIKQITILTKRGTDMMHAVIPKNNRNIPQLQYLNMQMLWLK